MKKTSATAKRYHPFYVGGKTNQILKIWAENYAENGVFWWKMSEKLGFLDEMGVFGDENDGGISDVQIVDLV